MDEKNLNENVDEALRNAERRIENAGCSLRDEITRETDHCMCGMDGEYCHCREMFSWLGFLAITFAALWLRAHFLSVGNLNWFHSLVHPVGAPPAWVYLLAGVVVHFWLATAMWMTWIKGGVKHRAIPMILFLVLLTLEIFWSYGFFHHHDPFLGFICNIWIFATLVLLIGSVSTISRCAVKLLMPITIWTIYLIILNYEYWRVN